MILLLTVPIKQEETLPKRRSLRSSRCDPDAGSDPLLFLFAPFGGFEYRRSILLGPASVSILFGSFR